MPTTIVVTNAMRGVRLLLRNYLVKGVEYLSLLPRASKPGPRPWLRNSSHKDDGHGLTLRHDEGDIVVVP
jgi:hypothetical protein